MYYVLCTCSRYVQRNPGKKEENGRKKKDRKERGEKEENLSSTRSFGEGFGMA
jgi:hypothetical protein